MTIHLGYSTLEEFLKQSDDANPLYTMLITDPGTSQQHGIRSDRLVILCQQPEYDVIHYCRIPVGRLTYINGDTPFDPDAKERTQQATAAYNLVTTWLQEQGYKLITATIATPTEMRYLDGWASFLAYSKDRGFYRDDDPLRHAADELGSSR